MNLDAINALKEYQEDRRNETRLKILKAIEILEENAQTINFQAVSQTSGISRKTLYKVQEFKDLIKTKRHDKNEAQYKKELSNALSKVRILEQENAQLKNNLKTKELIKNELLLLREFITQGENNA